MKFPLLSFFFLLPVCVLQGESPYLHWDDFSRPLSLNGREVVQIRQGDDLACKEPEMDDTAWQTVSLPGKWDNLFSDYNGICWYRLHLRLPEELPPYSLGINLGVIVDADEVYLNGHLIGKSGTIEGTRISAYDKIRIYEFPFRYLRPGEDNLLALRIRGIFTYMNGPYHGNLRLDGYGKLLTELHLREVFDLLFVITYMIVGGYFLLFFLRRQEDKENVFFALFCLGIGIYFFLRSQWKHTLGLSFYWTKKSEYFILCWLIYLLMEFLIRYFKQKHLWIHFLFLGITVFSSLVILFTHDYILWDNFNLKFILPSMSIGVGSGFYVVVSKLRRELDARLMFAALIILLLTFANDILVNAGVYKSSWLTGYGFFFFIVSIAVILSNRFVRLHNIVADLNVNLEKKVVQRTEELRRTVIQLEDAKGETDNILQNVQEGIFLLDSSFRIGRNYSRTLEKILEEKDLGGLSLPLLLKRIIQDKYIDQLEDYLEILFTRDIPIKRLQRLNPLEEIKAIFTGEGENREKYLNFAFSRVRSGEGEVLVLATVRDVSERIRLSREVAAAKKEAERESLLFIGIIHIDPVLLKNFLKEAHLEIQHIEEMLKKAHFSRELKPFLRGIYTAVHAVKGNAGMLDISPLAEEAHILEERVKDYFKQESVTPLDMIELIQGVHRLKGVLDSVNKLITRLTSFENSFGKVLTDREYIVQALKHLVQRVAEREGKQASLDCGGFKLPEDHSLDSLLLKKVLMQLVKNGVTHGITLPEERVAAGKPPSGKLWLESEAGETEWVIIVADDGGTLDPEGIRQAALDSGLRTPAELDAMDTDKVMMLIFETGFSTKDQVTIDAGRGIGLDVVAENIRELGGRITLHYTRGQSTRFEVHLPRS